MVAAPRLNDRPLKPSLVRGDAYAANESALFADSEVLHAIRQTRIARRAGLRRWPRVRCATRFGGRVRQHLGGRPAAAPALRTGTAAARRLCLGSGLLALEPRPLRLGDRRMAPLASGLRVLRAALAAVARPLGLSRFVLGPRQRPPQRLGQARPS